MAYRSFSLIPTSNKSVLADRFSQIESLFSRLSREKLLSDTPAYNLLKNGERHELIVSVPGYSQDELDVSLLNKQLTVRARPNLEKPDEEEKEVIKWLHHGIKKSEFSLSFTLEHRIVIEQVNLSNGLLTLHFSYDVPEQEKPKKIVIGIKNESRHSLEHNAN